MIDGQRPRFVVAASKDLKKLFPERFNFGLMNDNFQALAALPNFEQNWILRVGHGVQRYVCNYVFDKLTYRCTISFHVQQLPTGEDCATWSIRLSNDGFLSS